ncbi:MAG TPA: glycosyltransferase [Bacteroidales bacterium]
MPGFITVHSSIDTKTGDYIRIFKLNSDLRDSLPEFESLEVILINFQTIFKIKKILAQSPILKKRFFVPFILPFGRFKVVNKVNHLVAGFILKIIVFFIKPVFIVGEMHGSWDFIGDLKFKGLKVIDLHGAAPEEALYSNLMNDFLFNDKLEKSIYSKVDILLCQSGRMASHLAEKYGKRDHVFIYKCGVDITRFYFNEEVRKNVRTELSIASEDIVLVYSGGFHKWQMIEETLRCYSFLKKKSKLQLRFLLLTNESSNLVRSTLEQFGLVSDDVIVKNCKHEEVSKYLNAADLGFLIREDTIMNQVAFPTKMGEYLACGLPLITTEVSRYWDISKTYEDKVKCAFSLDINLSEDSMERLGRYIGDVYQGNEDYRVACSNLAKDILSREVDKLEVRNKVIPLLKNLYLLKVKEL